MACRLGRWTGSRLGWQDSRYGASCHRGRSQKLVLLRPCIVGMYQNVLNISECNIKNASEDKLWRTDDETEFIITIRASYRPPSPLPRRDQKSSSESESESEPDIQAADWALPWTKGDAERCRTSLKISRRATGARLALPDVRSRLTYSQPPSAQASRRSIAAPRLTQISLPFIL